MSAPAPLRALVAPLLLLFLLAAPLGAQGVTVLAYAPERAVACEPVEVSVAVTVPGHASPRIGLPSFAPFELMRTTSTPSVALDASGRVTTLVESRYVLMTDRTGTFVIPPFEVRHAGMVGRSRPMRITVASSRTNVPNVVTRAEVDTSLEVNFRALALPETVYVGQQATYEVAVFLSESVRDRMRRNPTFYPPDMQSMLAYDLPAVRGEPPRRRAGGACFDALVYQRAIFPLVAGRQSIAPAQLVYSLAQSTSIFSREEQREARTDSVPLVVLEPPAAGRPADFGGAVGRFTLSASLDSGAARVGDAVLLTVRVSGEGNVKLLPRPSVAVPWATLVAADERTRVDSASTRIHGTKEFDWILTPRVAGEFDLPPVRYSYFDPQRKAYDSAVAPAIRLSVGPGALATVAPTTSDEERLTLRAAWRGAVPRPLFERPAFWLVVALAPLPALGLRARSRRASRAAPSAPPLETLRAITLAGGTAPTTPAALRRAYVGALAHRIGLSPESFTREGALARALRRSGVSRTVAGDAEALLRQLDEAAFGGAGASAPDAAARALALCAAVDDEALGRDELRLPGALPGALALALLLGAAAASAAAQPEAAFDSGRAAYATGRMQEAARRFAESARAEPRAIEAWANLGTAAWASGDTAVAVLAWQRALRLDPLASDARDRLDMVHAMGTGDVGFVPPLPVGWLAAGAALAWCVAWLGDAHRRRGGRVPRGLPLGAGALAVVLALVAFDVRGRLADRDLAVVARAHSLREAPALGAARGASVLTGEVARVVTREGGWSRVLLDGEREGWAESAALLPIAGSDVPLPARRHD